MAVTKAYPRIKVGVQVDEVVVQEHEDDDEKSTDDTVTKYVEAKSGADFALSFQVTPPWPKQSILFQIHLDGKYARGTFAQQRDWIGTSCKFIIGGSASSKNGQWYQQNFCFSDLSIGMLTQNVK
jgi:hypothetical protein